nr:MAG: putative RNA-dependent RNA polymerase [Narnaviridae sp.]
MNRPDLIKTTQGNFSRKGLTVKANDQKMFDHQLRGFAQCMKLWYHTMNIRCNEEQTFQYLKRHMNCPLHQLPKIFKQNLAVYFSVVTEQELPEIDKNHWFDIVEPHFRPLLRKRWQRPRRKIRDLWNLLQSKVAANEVPQSMILEAYKKHQNLLSSIGKTPEHVLQHVRLYARQFAEKVKKNYREIIPLANSKACFSHNRDQGGSFKSLQEIITRVEKRVNGKLSQFKTRIDPPCIYLKGSPGIGKSFISNLVIKELSERFGEKHSVYARNFDSDHFDDYHGQLIFMVDDAFQKKGKDQHDHLIDQMIQIKSNNEFIVPMADIKHKGTKFSSEFILLSSNTDPIQVATSGFTDINCPKALLRRLVPYWEILERKRNGIYRVRKMNYDRFDSCTDKDALYGATPMPLWYGELNIKQLVNIIVQTAIEEHREAAENAFKSVDQERPKKWTIPVIPFSSPEEPCMAYSFPYYPPSENSVKAHAIPEPLKVRMITKGDSNCFALKPLQQAMFQSLKEFDCFYPGTKTEETEKKVKSIFDHGSGQYILSGDYESATDNLNMDIMEVFIQELKKVFCSNIPLCSYLDYEGGKHTIHYPKWTKLEPIVQSKGQLMGSLLSFPILCVANAATLGLVRKEDDLNQLKALINGDDILFCDSVRKIESWKRVATSMGLKPSIGKNYCSKIFGTINSQLFIRSKRTNEFRIINTGKFKTILSRKVMNTKTAFENGFDEKDIVIFSKAQLSKTPQSLDIPIEYGGLGREFRKENNRLDRRIYLQFLGELSDVHEVGRIPELNCSIIRGPKYYLRDFMKISLKNSKIINRIQIYEQSIKDSLQVEEDKPFRLSRFQGQQMVSHPKLRDFLNKGDLERAIPLNLLKNMTLAIPTDLCEQLKINVKSRLLSHLRID